MASATTANAAMRREMRPWNPTAIGGITLLFTFLPGGILWALNSVRLGQSDSARPRILGVAVAYVAFWFLAFANFGDATVQEIAGVLIPAMHGAASYFFYYHQKAAFKTYVDAGGKAASMWLPAAFSLMFFLALVVGSMLYLFGPQRVARGPGYLFNLVVAGTAYERGGMAAAAPTIKKLAEAGDADFQLEYALMHIQAQGVERNLTEAMRWALAAAEQGNANAQHLIGTGYENGEGVSKDAEVAGRWYTKAAEQGYAPAQHSLGIWLHRQSGDLAKARKWLAAAAEQGFGESQYALGLIYLEGVGVAQDEKMAREWLQKAADQWHEKAKRVLQSQPSGS